MGKDDPNYLAILSGIERAKVRLDEVKRFDMPDFVPRPEYIREMKRYGVLSADHDPSLPVDVYDSGEEFALRTCSRFGKVAGKDQFLFGIRTCSTKSFCFCTKFFSLILFLFQTVDTAINCSSLATFGGSSCGVDSGSG